MNSTALKTVISEVLKLNLVKPASSARLLSNQQTPKQPEKSSQKDKPTESYQVPQFFQYNAYSYFDIEKEMVKYRLPQPSALPHHEFTWSHTPPTQKKK